MESGGCGELECGDGFGYGVREANLELKTDTRTGETRMATHCKARSEKNHDADCSSKRHLDYCGIWHGTTYMRLARRFGIGGMRDRRYGEILCSMDAWDILK